MFYPHFIKWVKETHPVPMTTAQEIYLVLLDLRIDEAVAEDRRRSGLD